MIYFKYILFLIAGIIFCSNISASYIISKDTTDNKKAILIPNYNIGKSEFEFEYLGKNRKVFYQASIGYTNDYKSVNLSFLPYLNYKKFKFKMNLEYFIDLEDSNSLTNDFSIIGLIEKIDYLELKLFDEKINLFLGEISNLSFGHGYLLNKYGNNYNYPIDKNVGAKLKIKNSSNSIVYNSFISNLDQILKNGGLLGNHISLLVSKSIPLRIGFGHIIDFDQFIEYKDYIDKSREIHAFEIDFDIPIFNILKRNVLLIGELSAVKFPETRYYKRVDDNEFTNDKKSRNGVWGLLFPGFKYSNKDYSIIFGLNYNSSVFSPYYFNHTYDFEKIRYRIYNISQNEENFSDEADLLIDFSNDELGENIFIPKDLHGMINGYENTYPTYGFSVSFEKRISNNNYFNIEYSYFDELRTNDEGLSFNDLLIDFSINRDLFSFPTNLTFFISKTFFETSTFYSLDENLIYGLNFNFNIYKNLFISTDWKDVFYDNDFNGEIDKVSYINTTLKLKF